MAMTGLSPLRDFMSLRDAMDRFFEDRWLRPGAWLTLAGAGTEYLPLDIYETPDDIVVRALVPGVSRNSIDVQYEHGVLTIQTKADAAEAPEGATWLVREIGAGQAVRQISLPRTVDVDKATTSFENGVLTLTLPKTADAKPRQIKVEPAAQIGAGAAAN
jgi:HSP20 family protein